MNPVNQKKDLLLIEETEQKFGYNPSTLSYGSVKKILHKCDICGQLKQSVFRKFIRNEGLSHIGCANVKRKQTCRDRYGVDNPLKSSEIQQRRKQTCRNKYGEDHPLKFKEIKEKRKQTYLKNYEVDHPWKSKRIREKRKKTYLERYGVDNPQKFKQVRQKWRRTNLEGGNHWTEERAREYTERFRYELLKWGGGVHKKSKYKCPKGDMYIAKFNDFQQGHRCPICNESKGERKVAQILIKLGLPFERQFILKDTKLKLDFFISSFNFGIEYDGEHHFRPVQFGGISIEKAQRNLKKQQEWDTRKNQICQDLGIELLRIKYSEDIISKLSIFSV